jgi:hypothetical protein
MNISQKANANRRYSTKNRHCKFHFFTNCLKARPQGQQVQSQGQQIRLRNTQYDIRFTIFGELSMSIQNPTLAHFRHFSHFRHSFNYNIFPVTLNYAKQTQSQVRHNQRNLLCVKDIRTRRTIGYSDKQSQNKPNSNPIKPNLSKGQN